MLPKLRKYVINGKRLTNVKHGHTYIQWAVALLSSSAFLEYGLFIGWVSPMKRVLQSKDSPTGILNDVEVSFVATSSTLAAVVGLPISLYVTEVYGRKKGVLITMLFYAISWIIKLFARDIYVLMAARICGGFGFGGAFVVVPMYVREISQDSIRGILVSLPLAFQNVGVLAVYAMGIYFSYYTILWIVLVFSVLTILLLMIAPESPVFLVKRGKIEAAAKLLAKLKGLEVDDLIVQKDIEYMKNEDSFYKLEEKLTYIAILKNKAWRKEYFLCQILVCCGAFHGNFAIVTYAWSIMAEAGVSVNPELQTFIVPVLMMCGSIVPVLIVERTGRKPLFIVAYLVSAVALGSLASVLLVQHSGAAVPCWVPGVTIAVIVFFYTAGVLPLPHVIMNDMFKFQVRGKLLGLIYMIGWGSISLQVLLFLPISKALGQSTVFYISMAVDIAGALIVLIFLPETKGRTVEQIEAIMVGNKVDSSVEATGSSNSEQLSHIDIRKPHVILVPIEVI